MPESADIEQSLRQALDQEMTLKQFKDEVMDLVWNDDSEGLQKLCDSQYVVPGLFVEKAIEEIAPNGPANDLAFLLARRLIEAAPHILGVYERPLNEKANLVPNPSVGREIIERYKLPPPAAHDEAQRLKAILQLVPIDTRHRELRSFVRDKPCYALGHFQLGLSYLFHRFRTALGLGADNIIGAPDHASRYELQKHLEEAEAHFKRAAELDPGLRDIASVNIAAVKVFRHRYGPAILYIEEQLSRPHHEFATLLRSCLGVAYREFGDFDRALAVFRSLKENPPKFLHRHFGLTYLWQEDLNRAQASFKAQLEEDGEKIDEAFLRAIQAESRGDITEAGFLYREIAAAYRHHPTQEISGLNAQRRNEELSGTEAWELEDFCDDLSYST